LIKIERFWIKLPRDPVEEFMVPRVRCVADPLEELLVTRDVAAVRRELALSHCTDSGLRG